MNIFHIATSMYTFAICMRLDEFGLNMVLFDINHLYYITAMVHFATNTDLRACFHYILYKLYNCCNINNHCILWCLLSLLRLTHISKYCLFVHKCTAYVLLRRMDWIPIGLECEFTVIG